MSEATVRQVGVIDRLGVALLCGAAVLAAVFELLLVPLYAGATLVPITVLLAVATNVALPVLARTLVPTTAGAAAPYVAWLLVVFAAFLLPRPEGDVILPGGGSLELVGFGVLLGGGLAGSFAIALTADRPT